MIRWHKRHIVVVAVLVALLLGATGLAMWDLSSDYEHYRFFVESAALPGEEPTGSLKEFLQFRRVIAFAEAANRLEETKATAEEVRNTLGEPDHVNTHEGESAWFYARPELRGRRNETIVVRIDLTTSQVTSISYIVH